MNLRERYRQARNVPGLGSNLVVVIVVLAVGVTAAGFLLPHYDISFPWSNEYRFAAVIADAPGMRAATKHEVEIAGIQVGTVKELTPVAGGHARIEMAIDPTFKVYRNATLEVRERSPINDVEVALFPGDPKSGELPEGGTIPLTQTRTFQQPYQVLDKLDARTRAALPSLLGQADVALASASQDLPGGLRATNTTLDTLKPVVDALQKRRDSIQKLVTSLSDIAQAVGNNDQRLASLITSLQETLSVLDTKDAQLRATLSQLPGFTGDLQHAMTSATNLTTQLNPTLDDLNSASDRLPGALSKVTDTVEKARPLVESLQPVVSKAKPLAADLKPLVGDLHSTADDLKPTTGLLPDATARIAPWMPNLAAFVYHTSSSFSLADANGGLGRAQVTVDVTNPAGGLKPQPLASNGSPQTLPGPLGQLVTPGRGR